MNNLVLITGRQYSGRHKFCNQFGTQNRYSFVFPYTTRYIEDKRIRYASDNEFNNLCLNGDIISIADMGSYRHGIPKLNFNKNLVALIDIRMIYDIVRYAKDNMKIYVIVLDKSEKERYNKYIKLKDRDYHDHVLREDMEDYLFSEEHMAEVENFLKENGAKFLTTDGKHDIMSLVNKKGE